MLDQTRTSAERDYNAACAEHAREGRKAAEACNALATAQEATALAILLQTLPAEAPFMACAFFEERGWPSRDVDVSWLDATGQLVWRAAEVAGGV